MAKPSITNIRPPSKSGETIWTPSKSVWDLNTSDWETAEAQGWAADHGDTAFEGLTAKVNTNEPSPIEVTNDDLGDYDYIFFGVNGGSDETVKGKTDAAGIIVTGNGNDTITGGDKDDQIWAGNGKDVVHGGGGNDIIFGENGADTIYGDGDDGTAGMTGGGGSGNGFGNAKVWDHDPTTTPEPLPDNGARQYQAQQEGFWTDANNKVWRVFSFANPDDEDQIVTYEQSGQVQGDAGVVAGEFNALAGKTTYFLVDDASLTDQGRITITFDDLDGKPPNGGNDIEYERNHTTLDSNDPNGGQGTFVFEAGDQLVGGNGPDKFVYAFKDVPTGGVDEDDNPITAKVGDGVDLIWDFNQGDGGLPTLSEGDVLVLKNSAYTQVSQLTSLQKLHDVDGDGSLDLVLLFGDDQAIGLVGISSLSQITVQFEV